MVNVVRFPGGAKTHEEAAQWVAKLDRGLADNERNELHAWLEAEPGRRAKLLELAELWAELDVLSELSELFPLDPQADAPRSAVPARPAWRPTPWALTASVAGISLTAALWLTLDSREIDVPVSSAGVVESFRTPVGAQAERPLPDGSIVRLNTGTEIEVTFTADRREIDLRRGEANFDVVPDPARPFTVRVAGRVVQAVGTAFNVRLERAGEIEVIVTEGRVRVGRLDPAEGHAASYDVTLLAGEAAFLPELDEPSVGPRVVSLAQEDIDARLGWQRNMLIFRGAPLEEVLAEFARYTTVEFVLEDEALGSERVGGTLPPGEIDALLGLLHDNLGIEAERAGERILLRTAALQGRTQ